MANILYISLTGMTEPLGRSQVLEYLVDLSQDNTIYLISFEREHDLDKVDEIKALLDSYNIEWHYMVYSNKYGVASTVGQMFSAVRLGSKLIKTHTIDIIHARSMIPATMGLILKKWYGVKLLFDIRGFAIDEKVDSGRLKKDTFLYKILKKLDNYLYKASDHIVTLTHVAKEILEKTLDIEKKKITVIPTCANKKIFIPIHKDETKRFKESLGYAEHEKIILHTGTVSLWYDFEKELILVREMMEQDESLHFLVLNKNEKEFIEQMFLRYQMPKNRVKVSSSSFDEVYKYLNMADASLFFIKPSFSKQASAPTKFAENVACHLPSITNGNVGDMGYYLRKYPVGMLVEIKTLDTTLKKTASKLLSNIHSNNFKPEAFDRLFSEHFDKDMAVKKYGEIYNKLVEE